MPEQAQQESVPGPTKREATVCLGEDVQSVTTQPGAAEWGSSSPGN